MHTKRRAANRLSVSASRNDASADDALYKSWLGALHEKTAVSLQVQAPDCSQLWRRGGRNAAMESGVADFARTLMSEMDLVASAAGSHSVAKLHWGAGAANMVSAAEFLRIKHHIDFWFDLMPGCAHAIDLDPRRVTRETAVAYAAAGVTHASLSALMPAPAGTGGTLSVEPIRAAASALREAGIGHLNLDLVYGPPGPSIADLADALRRCADFAPNSMAFFGPGHGAGLNQRAPLVEASAAFPGDERSNLAEFVRVLLRGAGYEDIGLDRYVRSGQAKTSQERRAQRGVRAHASRAANALIGFGPSAMSALPGGVAQNKPTIAGWRRAVLSEALPIRCSYPKSFGASP